MYNQCNHSNAIANNQLAYRGIRMGILRIAVVLWLFLPLIILVINRYWHAYRTSHYPAAHTGRVVGAVYSKGVLGGAGSTRLSYAYRVMGVDYTSLAFIDGKTHKVGDDIAIRYNPSQPAQSIVWKPMKRSDWLALALIWLSLSLGYAIFCIFISLYLLGLLTTHRQNLKRSLVGAFSYFSIIITVLGVILMLLAGVSVLGIDGFWAQNWLRGLWNLAGTINWNSVIGIVEGIVAALVLAPLGGLFIILRKKIGPWLALALVVVIFLAIIFLYSYIRIDYIEPLLTPQVLK